MQGDGQVGWDCPRCGSPYDHADLFPGEFGKCSGYVGDHRKFYIYGRCRVIVIFHLRLGEGCLARGTPVDRFFPLVDITAEQQFPEFLYRCGLVIVIHRDIWIIPFSEHTKTLELFSLNIKILSGIRSAKPSFLRLWDGMLFLAQFLVYLMLYGKAVTVPSRDIHTVESAHAFRFYDNVLDYLVQCRS